MTSPTHTRYSNRLFRRAERVQARTHLTGRAFYGFYTHRLRSMVPSELSNHAGVIVLFLPNIARSLFFPGHRVRLQAGQRSSGDPHDGIHHDAVHEVARSGIAPMRHGAARAARELGWLAGHGQARPGEPHHAGHDKTGATNRQACDGGGGAEGRAEVGARSLGSHHAARVAPHHYVVGTRNRPRNYSPFKSALENK